PARPAVRVQAVTDRYIDGTGLRLRRMADAGAGSEPGDVYKLGQKISHSSRPGAAMMTNLYLSEAEYGFLAARLDGSELRKTRHSMPPMIVDVFEPPLDGLIMAEVEFACEGDMLDFVAPAEAAAEVTADVRFTGGELVRLDHGKLSALLGEYAV